MADLDAFEVLADVPRVLAHERGMQTAMIFGDRETSYGDFDSHSSQVANGLISEGCAPGLRVAFLDKNSDWYFEALFGAAKANAVLKRERLGIALGNGPNAYKKRHSAFTARDMREECYDQMYGRAPRC